MIETFRLEDMIKGWFIGNFEPVAIKTDSVEVAVKQYKAGDRESKHYHKIATELTIVLNGEIEMSGRKYGNGDIIKILPGIQTDFAALTDVTTVVVKIPGAVNDKYILEV